MKQINYYETYQDDFVQSQDQEYKLPEDYKWIHKNPIYKLFSEILYRIAYIISLVYCRFFLHIKIKNAKILLVILKMLNAFSEYSKQTRISIPTF